MVRNTLVEPTPMLSVRIGTSRVASTPQFGRAAAWYKAALFVRSAFLSATGGLRICKFVR